ncbi:D-xylulose reductase [Porphyridium purpureum]|uniref:D-xylulose reductase n=1 Tax=Porphyridium purpureum TaxID=35688 RepID=A0A5J4Z6I8_PORPP|nr:D-xylulose reductase [Porphyridium purpureum]|eukprot:POR5466..scf295_1
MVVADEVVFVAPERIEVRVRDLDVADADVTREGSEHVLIETAYSAISAGTEMLLYKGLMPADVPLDAVFSHAQAAASRYPVRYGYALVGHLSPGGQRVFAFLPHASRAKVRHDELGTSVLDIPHGVSMLDGLLMPNVETALSVVMDAQLEPGARVAVFGQGVVGLLTAAVIKTCYPMVHVSAVDVDVSRLRRGQDLGWVDQAVPVTTETSPAQAREQLSSPDGRAPDVCIEVSGNPRALDLCLESVADHGRIVLASWYGNKHVELHRLGARFHRSHVTLVASQVSTLPASLLGRWDKKRRMELVWRLVALIRPSQLISHFARIEHAQELYKLTARSEALQGVLEYKHEIRDDTEREERDTLRASTTQISWKRRRVEPDSEK